MRLIAVAVLTTAACLIAWGISIIVIHFYYTKSFNIC